MPVDRDFLELSRLRILTLDSWWPVLLSLTLHVLDLTVEAVSTVNLFVPALQLPCDYNLPINPMTTLALNYYVFFFLF